jgi:hypothetical protein
LFVKPHLRSLQELQKSSFESHRVKKRTLPFSSLHALSLRRPNRRYCAEINLALSMPSVVCSLHAEPDGCTIAEEFTEADGDGGGNGFCFSENIVKMLAGNAEEVCDFNFRTACRWHDNFTQQCARMTGATVGISLCRDFSHFAIPQ